MTFQEITELNLIITNLKSAEGVVQVLIFSGPEGFPDKPDMAVKQLTLNIKEGESRITIRDLPIGHYAISTFHDPDQDGKLDTNIFGVPRDGYGFSNNVKGTFGPPSFQKSAFALSKKKTEVIIRLNY